MRLRVLFLAPLLIGPLVFVAGAQTPAPLTSTQERIALHSGPDWETIAPHLPDPLTASAAQLETAGDVLRARRFPEDALDYYGYAMARGGDVSELLNKMGVVRLELRQVDLAHEMFLRTVHANRHNAEGWNNLGVTEYVSRNYRAAISDYRRASKLNRHSAVFHVNMGMAYFENKDADSARRQFTDALKLDPTVLRDQSGGGTLIQIVGAQNYPELCFEMARVFAHEGKPAMVRLWLAKASEGGFDVLPGMRDDAFLRLYVHDTEVRMILSNAAALRKRTVAAAPLPSLGAGTPR